MRVAGFWVRVLAGVVDLVPAAAVGGLVFFFWARFLAMELPRVGGGLLDASLQLPFEPDPLVRPGLALATLAGLSVIYFETVYWHATLGQRLFGLVVVGPDGEGVGWARALVRTVALGVSTLYLGLGVLWIGFDRVRQGWHDKVAGTYVVHKRSPLLSRRVFVR